MFLFVFVELYSNKIKRAAIHLDFCCKNCINSLQFRQMCTFISYIRASHPFYKIGMQQKLQMHEVYLWVLPFMANRLHCIINDSVYLQELDKPISSTHTGN